LAGVMMIELFRPSSAAAILPESKLLVRVIIGPYLLSWSLKVVFPGWENDDASMKYKNDYKFLNYYDVTQI
jgi:hypothetical protein